MKQTKHTRRAFNIAAVAGVALASAGSIAAVQAQQKVAKVGMTLPLTGADADDASKIQHGFQIAVDDANAKGGVAGYKIEIVTYDSGTATAGQYDPAQAATNTKKLISDPQVVAMYRELNELSSADRQAIQAMMDHLKNRKLKG